MLHVKPDFSCASSRMLQNQVLNAIRLALSTPLKNIRYHFWTTLLVKTI